MAARKAPINAEPMAIETMKNEPATKRHDEIKMATKTSGVAIENALTALRGIVIATPLHWAFPAQHSMAKR